jgi:hypothetical protein
MVCSCCGSSGHNSRTCGLSPKSPEVPRSEIRAAKALAAMLPPPNKSKKKVFKPIDGLGGCQNIWKETTDFYTKQKCRENTCSLCGGKGHNARTCVLTPIKNVSNRQCSLCGECGHNKRTCVLKPTEKKQKKCTICGELGHNTRTCTMKCQPCFDQVPRSYCFAGMTAAQAVKMTEILECKSIYGETEEYPQFVESPPAQRKTECITFGNGETIVLDLGTA